MRARYSARRSSRAPADQPSWVISTVTNISERAAGVGAAQRGHVAVVAAVPDPDVAARTSAAAASGRRPPSCRTTTRPRSGDSPIDRGVGLGVPGRDAGSRTRSGPAADRAQRAEGHVASSPGRRRCPPSQTSRGRAGHLGGAALVAEPVVRSAAQMSSAGQPRRLVGRVRGQGEQLLGGAGALVDRQELRHRVDHPAVPQGRPAEVVRRPPGGRCPRPGRRRGSRPRAWACTVSRSCRSCSSKVVTAVPQ